MAPQLQLNSGPQDALLYDNTRSYFTNVGYVRTSNFQMELRDIDPQNTASLGGTVNFVIPKARGPARSLRLDGRIQQGVRWSDTYSNQPRQTVQCRQC